MQESLLPMLRCPACKDTLSLEAWEYTGSEIHQGLLNCACRESFPIIAGVPRMLLGSLRRQLQAEYPAFFAVHRRRLPGSLSVERPVEVAPLKTQQSFGYEWTKFSEMRHEWEQNYWGYMAPLEADFFAGKTVLDAGCGMGRHLYYTAQHAEMAIGVDFSRAVDSAYRNVSHLPNAHVLQADLLQLPFERQTFDFIYCLGVLHHLGDPDAGLRSLLKHLGSEGALRFYVYWDLSEAPAWKRALLLAVTALRRVTTSLPHPMLAAACYPIACAAWLAFVLPHKVLAQIPAMRNLADTLPLSQYASYSFRTLLNDQFDRFSAPLERRYSAEEVAGWVQEAGLELEMLRPHWGWVAHTSRPVEGADRDRIPRGHRTTEVSQG